MKSKTAKKPAKELTTEEKKRIRSDTKKLFDIQVFGELNPTKKTMGLIIANERMNHGE
jgi:hypothetical protein